MVKFIIKILGFASLFLTSIEFCFATSQLVLIADKNEAEIGQAIRVELVGVSLKDKLSNINLEPLKKDFGLISDYFTNTTSDTRWPNQPVQILRFKLYPRSVGNIIIPSLSFAKHSSQKKNIHVIEGKTGAPEIITSSKQPYERQQILLQVSLTSPDSTARLSINKDATIKGFSNIPLTFKRTRQADGHYLLQSGWALTPLRSGRVQLDLPYVEYSVSGVVRKKFFLPTMELNSKKLPTYLPPTIPVGKITLQSEFSQSGILQTNTLHYWNLKISGNINNSYALPPLLRQIKSNNAIKFFPANSKRLTKSETYSVVSQVVHSIPFKSTKSGFLKLPKLNLQYFDPDTGKIKTIYHENISIFMLSVFWKSFISLLAMLLFYWMVKSAYKRWRTFKFSNLKREQAFLLLNENSSIKDIRNSIRLIAESEYWPTNTSLSQWQSLWSNKYKINSNLTTLINNISVACYCAEPAPDIGGIPEQLLKEIKNRKTR